MLIFSSYLKCHKMSENFFLIHYIYKNTEKQRKKHVIKQSVKITNIQKMKLVFTSKSYKQEKM